MTYHDILHLRELSMLAGSWALQDVICGTSNTAETITGRIRSNACSEFQLSVQPYQPAKLSTGRGRVAAAIWIARSKPGAHTAEATKCAGIGKVTVRRAETYSTGVKNHQPDSQSGAAVSLTR